MPADLVVEIAGTPVPVYLGENTTEARRQALLAKGWADSAASLVAVGVAEAEGHANDAAGSASTAEGARDVAVAAATDYDSLALAEAGSVDGDLFTYKDADGLPIYAKNVGGVVSEILAPWFARDKIGEPTVAQMLASTAPARGAGAIWHAGGFRYREAAIIAADHQLVTAGGVKLYVLPNADGTYNFAAWNPAADGVTDDFAKLRNALDIPHPSLQGQSVVFGGPVIWIPDASYFIGSTVDLRRAGCIRGAGSGLEGRLWPQFKFPADTVGVIFQRFDTEGMQKTIGAITTGSDGAIIEGIRFTGGGQTGDTTKHGIVRRARGTIINCFAEKFPGHGLYDAAGSDDNPIRGNSNLCRTYNTSSILNGLDGFHGAGTDSNASSYIACNANQNGRYGFNDSSFLGNSYTDCHASGNGTHMSAVIPVSTCARYPAGSSSYWQAVPGATPEQYVATEPGTNDAVWRSRESGANIVWEPGLPVGTYRAGGAYHSSNANARSHFSGCYTELGQGYNYLSQHSTQIGGTMTDAVVGSYLRGRFGAWQARSFETRHLPANNGAIDTVATLGSTNINTPGVLTFEAFTGSASSGTTLTGNWRLRYESSVTGWALGTSLGSAFNLTGLSHPVLPYKLQTEDIMLGIGTSTQSMFGRSRSTSSGAVFPTSGTFRRGDTYLSARPVAGDKLGYVCTTAGVAGSTAVFKAYGAIDA